MARRLHNPSNVMQSPLFSLAFVVLASISAVACGSYRVVSKTASGGTVALDGTTDSAREKAEEYMGKQCPFGYEIIPDSLTNPSVDREWRISYRCKSPNGQRQATAREVVIGF